MNGAAVCRKNCQVEAIGSISLISCPQKPQSAPGSQLPRESELVTTRMQARERRVHWWLDAAGLEAECDR